MLSMVVLFIAGMAYGQMAPLPLRSSIAWGVPLQPDVGPADNRVSSSNQTVPGVSADVPGQTANGVPADNSDGSPADDSSSSAAPSDTAGKPSSNNATDSASVTLDDETNTIKQLGTPFPLQLQPEGLKIGPCTIPSVSDSFFYAVNSAPVTPTETFAGNSISGSLICTKTFSRGVLAAQARGQFSFANSWHPYTNQAVGVTFNDQLSERWSLSASASFTYFQNSILANPQYLLSYQNAGIVQQTLFLQQNTSTLYESNNVSLSYHMGERTQLTLTPILGATFQDEQGGWSIARTFGGAVGITHTFSPNLGLGAFYSISHSVTSGVADSPGWNSQSIGFTFQYNFHQSWFVSGSVAATGQLVANVLTMTPTGTVTLMKRFSHSAISGAYSRSEAGSVIVSSGYFDQADIGYNQSISKKLSFNVGVGEFRTINTVAHAYGKRAGGGVSYQWTPRLSVFAGYSFAHQNGTVSTNFSPFLGNTNAFNMGLTWLLGARSGL